MIKADHVQLPAKAVLTPGEADLPLMAFLCHHNTALAEAVEDAAPGHRLFMRHVGCDVLMAGANDYDGATYFLGRLSFEGRPLALLQFCGRHQRPTVEMRVRLTDADVAERLVRAIRRDIEPQGLAVACPREDAAGLLDFGAAAEVSLARQTLRFREQKALLRLSGTNGAGAILLDLDDGPSAVLQRRGCAPTLFDRPETAAAAFISAIERETDPQAWPFESNALVLANRGNKASVALLSKQGGDMWCETVGDGDPVLQAVGSDAVPVFSRLAQELVNTTLALAATNEPGGPCTR